MRLRSILPPAARLAGLVPGLVAAGAAASALFTPEGLAWPKVGRGAAAVALAFLLALVYGAVLPRDPGGG